KHPQPWDFFNTMSDAAGEDLTWFWKSWFMNNWKLDQAVKGVKYVDEDPKQGAIITIVNKKKMPMPVTVEVKEANGESGIKELPVEIWQSGATWSFKYPSTSKVQSVEIDPEHNLPDINPANNVWEKKELKPAPEGMSASDVFDQYLQAIGGKEKVGDIEDMTVKLKATIQGNELIITQKRKKPDMYVAEVEVPAVDRVVNRIIVNGDDVRVISNGQEVPLNEKQKDAYQTEAIIFPELAYQSEDYKTELLGIQQEDGKEMYVVEVIGPDGTEMTIHYAVESGLKLTEKTVRNGNASTEQYSNYKEVDGIKIPFNISSNLGSQSMHREVQDVQINSGLKDSTFE